MNFKDRSGMELSRVTKYGFVSGGLFPYWKDLCPKIHYVHGRLNIMLLSEMHNQVYAVE